MVVKSIVVRLPCNTSGRSAGQFRVHKKTVDSWALLLGGRKENYLVGWMEYYIYKYIKKGTTCVCLPGIISDELDRHQQILLSFMSLVPTTYKCYFSILKPHPLKSTIISTLKLLD